MSVNGKNKNDKITKIRNDFFGTNGPTVLDSKSGNENKQRLKKLLEDKKILDQFEKLKKTPVEELLNEAMELKELIKNGGIAQEDIESAENWLCLLLGAIEDINFIQDSELFHVEDSERDL